MDDAERRENDDDKVLDQQVRREEYSARMTNSDFPGGPVVRPWHFHYWSLGLIPSWGTKIPQAEQHDKKNKREREGEIIKKKEQLQ